ncbi:MAG: glycosyltransferase family 2 protein [Bacteroidota bacterium]|nr:glycosyltransferase family 2 protein [Bacteroidota bacterium]
MDISVVVALLNEKESLPELTEWIVRVMTEHKFSYEIVFIDDGSNDGSWEAINELAETNSNIKAVKFNRNYGKSAALHIGFGKAQGDVVITMDADLQDDPEEIPELYDMIMTEGYDLVSGWKKKRYDPVLSKNIPSKLFNATVRMASGIKLHDFNCGLKAYKKSVVKSIEIYGDMHRFIPILAKKAGFTNITEKVVKHQQRKYGQSKFGISRFIHGFLDLISVMFITKFAKKPMHFFGTIGSFSFLIGFGILVYFSMGKIFFNQYNMTDRPLFYLGLLTVVFGSLMFVTGFLGELISRASTERNHYLIEDDLHF